MLISIDEKNINNIKNKKFYEEALKYIDNNRQLLIDIKKIGMDVAEYDEALATKKSKLLDLLKQKGAIFRNNNKSIYINYLSKACLECRKGDKSFTFFYSLRCNRDCYFCGNKNQDNYEYYVRNYNDIISEFKAIKNKKQLKAIALTGGEPLMYPERVFDFFKLVKSRSPLAHTRIYTNGDFLDESILKKMQRLNLNEIRFSIKPNDDNNYDTTIIEKLSKAKEYIPEVVVEMPVIPGTLEEMKELLNELEYIGITGINLLEFLYPWIRPDEFKKRGFKVKYRPYEILYSYNYPGGLPISGSEEECLELLLYALDKNFKMGVHYCSLENKLTSQIYNQNVGTMLMPYEVFSEKDFFIKTAKVYSKDIGKVIKYIKNVKECVYDEENDILEFHPKYIPYLPDDIEVAITYNVVENRGGDMVLEEINIDYTKPKIFEYDKDI
ncbi:MAG: radical SAM protein [Deferribacterota bacterium]|nr:radical SAM protein [Deferribacterota bacterium]